MAARASSLVVFCFLESDMSFRPQTARDLLEQANCGFVGIDAELRVASGYDEGEPRAALDPDPDLFYHTDVGPLPAEEKIKLGEEMVRRWQRYIEEVRQRAGA